VGVGGTDVGVGGFAVAVGVTVSVGVCVDVALGGTTDGVGVKAVGVTNWQAIKPSDNINKNKKIRRIGAIIPFMASFSCIDLCRAYEDW
jgi:hypothetical protein